jgi:hypothetical protein
VRLRLPKFIYPIPPAPKTAVLLPGLRSAGNIGVFPDGWNDAAARFAPDAVAGTLDQLANLGGVALTHAIIVIRREWEPLISEADRDRLWRAFRVPIFEQIVAEDGTLYAAECEAHDGLHIESRKFAVGDHEIDRSPCACGRTTPRFIAVKTAEPVRQVAAFAR